MKKYEGSGVKARVWEWQADSAGVPAKQGSGEGEGAGNAGITQGQGGEYNTWPRRRVYYKARTPSEQPQGRRDRTQRMGGQGLFTRPGRTQAQIIM